MPVALLVHIEFGKFSVHTSPTLVKLPVALTPPIAKIAGKLVQFDMSPDTVTFVSAAPLRLMFVINVTFVEKVALFENVVLPVKI